MGKRINFFGSSVKSNALVSQGQSIEWWNGSRCERSRSAGRGERAFIPFGSPALRGRSGRSATTATTLILREISVMMRLPWPASGEVSFGPDTGSLALITAHRDRVNLRFASQLFSWSRTTAMITTAPMIIWL